MPGIRLITFDLDDTLWDTGDVIARAEQAMLAWLDAQRPDWRRLGIDGLRAARREVAGERPEIAHDFTALRLAVVQRLLSRSGYSAALAASGAEAAFAAFYDERNRVRLFDGVADTLHLLSRRYTLHALSNGNADITRAGLGDLFSAHFSAASVGHAKPHPRMFEASLASAGVRAAEAVHIGDHPLQDISAACAAGMRTIWVNRAGEPWPGPEAAGDAGTPAAPGADAELRHFSELPALLERLAGEH